MNTLTTSASRSIDGSAVPFPPPEPYAHGTPTVGDEHDDLPRTTAERPYPSAFRLRHAPTTIEAARRAIAGSGVRRSGA
ncbi:hypothetical protein A5780_20480 [Nocardia sp. 852002-20019_SCH5090214]|jgi:hypothetical protein|uniref:Uncharacterized protein n=1 Tax=Nocardia nova TaxID=37330 RepID=A0A2S6ABS1_9NOCA|nr:hypothetical protein A5789_11610 [Nocardia sp. 852002-51101_SCH5132738]OBA60686.1 hypothetical protein A5780_20480 [Nocardia sp. 852002-20019_SCH5090214]OBB55203.1 hypothetical protein A5748_10555 [Nocardia sp. 852002-51244_SCH5132740]OBF87458.1 hypothetical protein A9X06_10685 [Mycobacterium sp. 852002-51759_SCH5129042]PPJ31210.1 hypothetical protein C5F51_06335 [Nocardia nova]